MSTYEKLSRKIAKKEAVLGIIGMGYVGIPLALAALEKGLTIVGFDIDKVKIDPAEEAHEEQSEHCCYRCGEEDLENDGVITVEDAGKLAAR